MALPNNLDAEKPTDFTDLDDYIEKNLSRWVSDLGSLCSPGSDKPAAKGQETALLIIKMLRKRGLRVESWPVKDRPNLIFARSEYKAHAPILLSYNTFQPEQPSQLDEWQSTLFGLNEINGKLYGQGIADNRANLLARLAAIEAWKAVRGGCPINVKFLVEARNQSSDSSLNNLLPTKAGALNADGCLWDAGENTLSGRPVLGLGQKGLLSVELVCRGLKQEADSNLAGILPNAAWRIVWALAAIKTDSEEIQIEGFDDDIAVPTAEDSRFMMANVRQHDDRVAERLAAYGQDEYLMELHGLPLLITEFFTPTANVNAMTGGTFGDNPKLGLVAEAKARLDFRLVPDQDPDTVYDLLLKHLESRGFGDIEVRRVGPSQKPARTSPNHPFVQITMSGLEEATGQPAVVLPLASALGPMRLVKTHLDDLPIVSVGTGYDGEGRGTPDENIREDDFARHIRFMVRLIAHMAERQPHTHQDDEDRRVAAGGEILPAKGRRKGATTGKLGASVLISPNGLPHAQG